MIGQLLMLALIVAIVLMYWLVGRASRRARDRQLEHNAKFQWSDPDHDDTP